LCNVSKVLAIPCNFTYNTNDELKYKPGSAESKKMEKFMKTGDVEFVCDDSFDDDYEIEEL
jgi:hypothetical protein